MLVPEALLITNDGDGLLLGGGTGTEGARLAGRGEMVWTYVCVLSDCVGIGAKSVIDTESDLEIVEVDVWMVDVRVKVVVDFVVVV